MSNLFVNKTYLRAIKSFIPLLLWLSINIVRMLALNTRKAHWITKSLGAWEVMENELWAYANKIYIVSLKYYIDQVCGTVGVYMKSLFALEGPLAISLRNVRFFYGLTRQHQQIDCLKGHINRPACSVLA